MRRYAIACLRMSLLRYSPCLLPQLGKSLNLPNILLWNLVHDLLLQKLVLADLKNYYGLLQMKIADLLLNVGSRNPLRNFGNSFVCFSLSPSVDLLLKKFASNQLRPDLLDKLIDLLTWVLYPANPQPANFAPEVDQFFLLPGTGNRTLCLCKFALPSGLRGSEKFYSKNPSKAAKFLLLTTKSPIWSSKL